MGLQAAASMGMRTRDAPHPSVWGKLKRPWGGSESGLLGLSVTKAFLCQGYCG